MVEELVLKVDRGMQGTVGTLCPPMTGHTARDKHTTTT